MGIGLRDELDPISKDALTRSELPGGIFRRLLFSILTLAAASLLGLVSPYITKLVVDDVIRAGRPDLLWPYVGIGVAAYAGASVTQFWGKWRAAKMGEEFWLETRNRVFETLQDYALGYHQSGDVGDHVARAQFDTYSLKQLYTGVLPSVVDFAVGVLATAVILVVMAPKLTLLAFIALPALALTAWVFHDKVRPLSRESAEQRGKVYSALLESMSNIESVKVYGAESWFEDRIDEAGRKLKAAELEHTRYQSQLLPLVNFSVAIVVLLCLGVGGQMVMNDTLTLGTLVAFVFYVSRSLGPVRKAPSIVFGWYRAQVAQERLDALFEADAHLPKADDPVELDQGVPRIEYDDVTVRFGEDDDPAVDGVSMAIEPQDRIALTGPSGAGKSTTARLLPRLIDPDEGEVRAGGVPLPELAVKQWRSRVGTVGQEVALFHGTIRDNILFGLAEVPSDDAIERACHTSAVDEIVEGHADGLEFDVGEGGSKLSGGQRKRVALARALLRDPDVLVVDQLAADLEDELCQRIFERIEDNYDLSILYVGHRIPSGLNPKTVHRIQKGQFVS